MRRSADLQIDLINFQSYQERIWSFHIISFSTHFCINDRNRCYLNFRGHGVEFRKNCKLIACHKNALTPHVVCDPYLAAHFFSRSNLHRYNSIKLYLFRNTDG